MRHLKKVSFVDLSDGSSYQSLLCVLSPGVSQNLKTGQSVRLIGSWKRSKGQEQEFELKTDMAEIIGDVPESYPLQKKAHSLQYLRTLPTLRWKTRYLSSILRFRSRVEMKLHEFFHNEGFTKTNPPIITASDCEGAGELFQMEAKGKPGFFGRPAYLTVSTQLHLEVLSAALGNVWSLSPTFRAEESDTNRHLSEFWMLEGEIAFVEEVRQLTEFTERMIKSVVQGLIADKDGMATDLLKSLRADNETKQTLQKRWGSLLSAEWACITYKEALDILNESQVKFNIPVKYEDGLASEHEKWLAGVHFQMPVFVTDYPREMKPFYMKLNEDSETVACFDLLVPEVGELIGGSIREHSLEKLKSEIQTRGMNRDEMQWYLSTRENATVPHGGFGLGFERLLCYLAGVSNVRDVVPFPRAHEECEA